MQPPTTVWMERCGIDRSLDGYVFSSWEHARSWLRQYAAQSDKFTLKEARVTEAACRYCRGSGFKQSIEAVRAVPFAEVVGDHPPKKAPPRVARRGSLVVGRKHPRKLRLDRTAT